jgi:hypothetical protein
MPLQRITFKPGINRENTNYANEGGWFSMDKVRFRSGSPQKIGGWIPAATGTYQGIGRALINWSTLVSENLIGIGTHLRYYINYGQTYYNITPLRATATGLSNPFATTNGSTTVTVTDSAHGAQAGDFVLFSGASAVGGITADALNRTTGYQVTSYVDANTYTITVDTAATSTTTGGGTVTAQYEIGVGLAAYSAGNGWGAGVWNGPVLGTNSTTLTGTSPILLDDNDTTINVTSTSGFPATGKVLIDAEVISYTGVTATSFTGCTRGVDETTAAYHSQRMTAPATYAPVYVYEVVSTTGTTGWGEASSTEFGVGQQLRLWSHDNYGQDLVIAPRGGGIYYWAKNTSTFPRAVLLKDALGGGHTYVPEKVSAIMTSDVSRMLVALGSNPYPTTSSSDFDPMVVRWSDMEDPTNWIPSDSSQAGDIRLSTGSFIVTGAKMKQELLIWTDAALYSMQYEGLPDVWHVDMIMSNLSIMSPNAVALVNNIAFWMGVDKFYSYNGRVDTLACSVRQYVFNDLAAAQAYQTFAGTNEGYTEVWWFYVSNAEVSSAAAEGRNPTPDKYVVYNHLENIWYYGTMRRTAWLDAPLQRGPLACVGDTEEGVLVLHEQGNDDQTTSSPQPIEAYIQSSDFDIGEGNDFMFVWRMLPDISFDGSTTTAPTATLTLYPRQNSGAPYGTADGGSVVSAQTYSVNVKAYTVQEFTQQLSVRVRGRQMAMRVGSTGLGVQWQLGAPRIDARIDGRKS